MEVVEERLGLLEEEVVGLERLWQLLVVGVLVLEKTVNMIS